MKTTDISGKKILLCVTGSIAAYKAVILARLLIKAGAELQVVMTRAAIDFVAPLTFSTLSKNKVLSDMFEEDTWTNHVMLGRWADLMIVAPASCNTIGKMASGICDNLLMAVYFSATCPVWIAPAMDEDMWNHTVTRRNLGLVHDSGNRILQVNHGELASGLVGMGRMLEPEEIMKKVGQFFSAHHFLKGIKALVTAGPTHEAIDPVRYISNKSTGTMGISIAEELAGRGAEVTLILGPVSHSAVSGRIQVVPVTTAKQMYESAIKGIKGMDLLIMAAAVADFTVPEPDSQKIKKKKNGEGLVLQLVRTEDILAAAGKMKTKKQTLAGFALETENGKENAIRKLKEKKADLIILNSLTEEGAGFGPGTNKISIFDSRGKVRNFEKKPKRDVARDIVDTIIEYRNA